MQLGKFKKAKNIERGKAPAPGERKAFRKRVLLSNDNALPVTGLEELSAQGLLDASNVGRMVALPNELVDQLRAVEAFKPTQSWGMFRQPSVLLRKESVELAKKMTETAGRGETLKLVISGDKLVGKSMLLLQAISNAFLNNWIVFHVPEGQELTNASTDYAPIPDTKPTQYSQQAYGLRLLQALRKANASILAELRTVNPHPELVQHFPVGSSLLQLANAAREPDSAWPIFNAVWSELMVKGNGRPPILFSVDGLAHIMKMSEYRSPAFEIIHAHDLALVNHFVEFLAGNKKLPNGGAVIAATARSNAPRNPSMELMVGRREAELGYAEEKPVKEPYGKGYDERVEKALEKVDVLKLRSVSRTEARSLMEYWAASGLLRTAVDEKTVSEKWMIGGNGNLGEMERVSLLTMRY